MTEQEFDDTYKFVSEFLPEKHRVTIMAQAVKKADENDVTEPLKGIVNRPNYPEYPFDAMKEVMFRLFEEIKQGIIENN